MTLNKYASPADFSDSPYTALVDSLFGSAREQHPMRRWEYTLALQAIAQHVPPPTRLLDVGGAGSPFAAMATTFGIAVTVIDPEPPYACRLEDYVQQPNLDPFPVVTCLSVLEHIPDTNLFLRDLVKTVALGGLLIITVDACRCLDHGPDQDPHHFRWMREQIFTPDALWDLRESLSYYGFELVDPPVDHRWPGPLVYDYSFAAVVMRRQPHRRRFTDV